MDFKKGWNKFLDIVWRDDSFKGWLISIIFIFLVIKFLFFPFLSLVTGTQLPLAIVESCSMHHDGNLFSDYDDWWKNQESKYSNFNLNKDDFEDFRFKKGFTKGDILFIVGANTDKLELGDIVIFDTGHGTPVIHRIVNIYEKNGEKFFSTMGDNNNGQLSFEKEISEDKIIGKAGLRIFPYLGWIKLIFYENSRSSSERGFCD